MFGQIAGEILERGTNAIANAASDEKSKIVAVFKSILSYPIKVLACFVAAPFLVVRVAWKVEDPLRKLIAIVGLLLALIFAYLAGTFLGTLAGAAIIASNVGILTAFGFLIGTTLSIYFSIVFSILVFNTVSFFFLKMSKQEVIDYLIKESK